MTFPFQTSSSRQRAPSGSGGRRARSRALVSLAVVALAACSEPTGLEEIRAEWIPPDGYRTLWSEVEACSGRTGDFETLRWFWVDSIPAPGPTLGQWNSRREITLARAALSSRKVVAHEILHDLLDGDPRHLHSAWDACGIPRGEG